MHNRLEQERKYRILRKGTPIIGVVKGG